MPKKETGILVVSFGTSYPDTRKKTIDAIENRIQEAYPHAQVVRAWTSGMIIRKLKNRDNYHVNTVKEAMEQMVSQGIKQVFIQPTHVINGIENEQMIKDVLAFENQFDEILFGAPLLTSEEDSCQVIEALMEEMGEIPEDMALVFMGHGTTHYANTVYAALDYRMKDMGYKNVFLGTVEAYPSLDTMKRRLREGGYKKVILAPFMIVAGDHARHDMASDEEDSWKYALEKEGYEISCVLKGLGEYKGIQELFLEHIRSASEEQMAGKKAERNAG